MDKNKQQNTDKSEKIQNGRIKGTSAFNIQHTEDEDEISWSNNKFESTCPKKDND